MESYLFLALANLVFYVLGRKYLPHLLLVVAVVPVAAAIAFESFVRFVEKAVDPFWVVSVVVTWLIGIGICLLFVFIEKMYQRTRR